MFIKHVKATRLTERHEKILLEDLTLNNKEHGNLWGCPQKAGDAHWASRGRGSLQVPRLQRVNVLCKVKILPVCHCLCQYLRVFHRCLVTLWSDSPDGCGHLLANTKGARRTTNPSTLPSIHCRTLLFHTSHRKSRLKACPKATFPKTVNNVNMCTSQGFIWWNKGSHDH